MKRRFNGEGTIYRPSDGRWAGTLTLGDGSRRTVYGRNPDTVQLKMQALKRARENGMLAANGRTKVERLLDSLVGRDRTSEHSAEDL